MLIKRIFLTLLITGVIAISAAATQAQSASRKSWVRGNSVNNPIPTVPDQAVESAPVAELQLTAQGSKKTDIVGSWLVTVADGNRGIVTFNSDGTIHSSVQTEVTSTEVLTPLHGVWAHLGGRQFGITSLGILYDINTGHLNGFIKVRALLTLNEAGDEMSGTDKVQILDPDGNVVETFSSGSTPYKRIKFEPFN